MKKIWKKLKNLAKRCWESVKKAAKKMVKTIEAAAQWCMDHSEVVMIASGAIEVGAWAFKKIQKTRAQREIDYQRTHIYDYSVGHHWSLRRELTSNEMLELTRRKSDGEALADILSSMRVLA